MTAHKSPAELRKHIAETIAGLKSYDVPDFCVGVGLAEGTKDEAFSGKFRSVMSRLGNLRGSELLAVARAILVEMPDPDLKEKLALYEQATEHVVSEPTRPKILDVLDGWDLNGRMELFEFLDAVYPVDKLPSAYSLLISSIRPTPSELVSKGLSGWGWRDSKEVFRHFGGRHADPSHSAAS